MKSQIPNSNGRGSLGRAGCVGVSSLKVGSWDFIGIWDLDIGISYPSVHLAEKGI
jgi:hypothetical protein